MKIVLDEGALMPSRGHAADGGLDLYAREDFTVPGCTAPGLGFASVGCAVHDTGVHVQIPEGYVGFLKGDKIIQLVLLPIITPDLELVESLEETERGTGGFGSTGR